MSWHDAKNVCSNKGGYLAIIATEYDNRIISFRMRAMNCTLKSVNFWIGIIANNLDEVNWIDQSPLNYVNFSLNTSPDYAYHHVMCVSLKNDGSWNLRDCEEKNPYICIIKKNVTTQSNVVNPDSVKLIADMPRITGNQRNCIPNENNNTCYYVSTDYLSYTSKQASWDDARQACQISKFHKHQLKVDLAVPTNFRENNFLMNLISSNETTKVTKFWLGIRLKDHVFSAISSASTNFYTRWNMAAFNNNSNITTGQCVIFLSSSDPYLHGRIGRWPCSDKLPFLCQTSEVLPDVTKSIQFCQKNYMMSFNSHSCYKVLPVKATFHRAQMLCKNDNQYARVVSPNNVNELAFVKYLISWLPNGYNDVDFWITVAQSSQQFQSIFNIPNSTFLKMKNYIEKKSSDDLCLVFKNKIQNNSELWGMAIDRCSLSHQIVCEINSSKEATGIKTSLKNCLSDDDPQGFQYTGDISQSHSSKPCLPWNKIKTNLLNETMLSKLWSEGSFVYDKGYCRNFPIFKKSGPFCFVAENVLELCDVKFCNKKNAAWPGALVAILLFLILFIIGGVLLFRKHYSNRGFAFVKYTIHRNPSINSCEEANNDNNYCTNVSLITNLDNPK